MEYVILIVVLGLFIIGSSFVSSVETAYTSISLID